MVQQRRSARLSGIAGDSDEADVDVSACRTFPFLCAKNA
jgi:hypothetical protein